jgi:hypothetical protein|tara:strand:- start:29 stop:319 length:291 start_codon:yes stop_codon:yes gene_type:complete
MSSLKIELININSFRSKDDNLYTLLRLDVVQQTMKYVNKWYYLHFSISFRHSFETKEVPYDGAELAHFAASYTLYMYEERKFILFPKITGKCNWVF